MSDRLLELAEKAGVEIYEVATRVRYNVLIVEGACDRPRLDIAHDLLAKIAAQIYARRDRLELTGAAHLWVAYDAYNTWDYSGTFEECVIALAKRAQEDKA